MLNNSFVDLKALLGKQLSPPHFQEQSGLAVQRHQREQFLELHEDLYAPKKNGLQ